MADAESAKSSRSPAGKVEARGRTGRRREEVKARLRAAMLEQVRAASFRDLRIESVAEAAGLSRSAFYFYYRDKHDLLMDSASAAAEQLYEQADLWWHGEGEPAELIGSALRGAAEVWVANGDVLRTTTEASTYDPELRAFWRTVVNRFVEATAEHIREEQRLGLIDRELDPVGMAESLVWAVERSFYVFIATGDREPADVVAALTALWLRALYGAGARDS